jgi:peroxiredoxin Q/BCP
MKEGDKVPQVTLQGIDGKPLPVAKLLGQTLVLYFYPKDDTSGCTAEALAFTERAGDFAKAGVRVVGVSKDPPAKHEKFMTKHGLKLELATDADGSVCEAFGTWIEKSMYGRKYMGIDRATFLIDRAGRVARIWRKVKVPGHAAEVLEAAKAIG